MAQNQPFSQTGLPAGTIDGVGADAVITYGADHQNLVNNVPAGHGVVLDKRFIGVKSLNGGSLNEIVSAESGAIMRLAVKTGSQLEAETMLTLSSDGTFEPTTNPALAVAITKGKSYTSTALVTLAGGPAVSQLTTVKAMLIGAKALDMADSQNLSLTGLQVTPSTLGLLAGEKATIIVTGEPATASLQAVQVASSSPKVASASFNPATGKLSVEAISAGFCQLTLSTAEGLVRFVELAVSAPAVSGDDGDDDVQADDEKDGDDEEA